MLLMSMSIEMSNFHNIEGNIDKMSIWIDFLIEKNYKNERFLPNV